MTEKKSTEKNKEETKLNTELENKYIKMMSALKDEEDHDYADELLSSFVKELGYAKLVDVYKKVPKCFE